MRLDLNADVGESFGAYSIGADEGLLRSVTSANVAAGFHGGDPSVIRATIRMAAANGVAIGAHPGFPDLAGFGRRELAVTPQEAEDFVLYQIAAIAGIAAAEGVGLQHVKPHGALYNMAARDARLASAVAAAVRAANPALILFGPPGSQLLKAGRAAGLRVAAEGFADRSYEADGSLATRNKPGAVISDASVIVSRALRIAREQTVVAVDGSILPLAVDTLCVHGDTPGADVLAARLREGLTAAGITLKAVAG